MLLEARGDHFFDINLVKDHAHLRVGSVAFHPGLPSFPGNSLRSQSIAGLVPGIVELSFGILVSD